ncbi:keratin, type I cytoskeletal 9 [Drosophila nasuta]|uniref:keratin, type I cytoskeletal 9 n=1 Tax=Drosophila nasuta TaxID=42062 RepID=UPI00295E9DB1|nr:keratin, type I cytoskeletal 9 [Drosophila nasuta]
MRLFVTLCSLLVLAQAKPQGYNYGSGVSGTLTGGGGSSSSFIAAPSNTQGVATYGPLGAFQGASVGSLLSSGSGSGSGSGLGGSTYTQGGGSTYTQGGGSTYTQGGGSTYNSGPSYSSAPSYSSGSSLGSSSSSNFGNSGSSGFAGFGPSPNIGFGGLAGYQAPTYQQQQQEEQRAAFESAIVHKQFFTVAAPDEHENLERVKHLVIGRPQKNYRVVFIKAPSSSSANVKLSAEYAPKEEKTVIYVLSKKDSSLEVNDIATPAPTIPSKPEVFFIKYKTDAEASHAQQQIQAEYDRIEGTSEHTDGGVAPAQSVVGILDAGHSSSGGSAGGIISSASTGSGIISSSGGSIGGGIVSGGSSGSSGSHIISSSGGSHSAAQSATYLPPSK